MIISTRVRIGVTVAAFAGAALVVSPVNPLAAHAQPVSASAVHVEDSPGWDCRAMGNHACGHHLPRWFHWKYATMAATRQECSTHNHPAVIVWITGGTSSSMVCPDGTSLSS